jgi:hypothetical protein
MIIKQLPREIQTCLEKHGIEDDSIRYEPEGFYIDFDDTEAAFQVRELMLKYRSCCLTAHPTTKKPSLLTHKQ